MDSWGSDWLLVKVGFDDGVGDFGEVERLTMSLEDDEGFVSQGTRFDVAPFNQTNLAIQGGEAGVDGDGGLDEFRGGVDFLLGENSFGSGGEFVDCHGVFLFFQARDDDVANFEGELFGNVIFGPAPAKTHAIKNLMGVIVNCESDSDEIAVNFRGLTNFSQDFGDESRLNQKATIGDEDVMGNLDDGFDLSVLHGATQLGQGNRFDLANAFASDCIFLPNVVQGFFALTIEIEALSDDTLLFLSQNFEDLRSDLLEVRCWSLGCSLHGNN